MDIKEVKAWRMNPLLCVMGHTLDVIDWLIDEVERLTEELELAEIGDANIKEIGQYLEDQNRLTAENARLREALGDIRNQYDEAFKTSIVGAVCACIMADRARQALKEGSDGSF